MAGVSRRARRQAEWTKSWCSRWRRPTAACHCVFQRSTQPCKHSTKTGCRARTPHKPARCCTPSTKPRTRATHSRPTCSGDRAEEVLTPTLAHHLPQITASFRTNSDIPQGLCHATSHRCSSSIWPLGGSVQSSYVKGIAIGQRWAPCQKDVQSPFFCLFVCMFVCVFFFFNCRLKPECHEAKGNRKQTHKAKSYERQHFCELLLPVHRAIS